MVSIVDGVRYGGAAQDGAGRADVTRWPLPTLRLWWHPQKDWCSAAPRSTFMEVFGASFVITQQGRPFRARARAYWARRVALSTHLHLFYPLFLFLFSPSFSQFLVIFYIPPDHLILDNTPNLGPLISRWKINQFENCWYKSVRILEALKLLFQQFLNLSCSQRDMSGPILGALSNNRWSGGTRAQIIIYCQLTFEFIYIVSARVDMKHQFQLMAGVTEGHSQFIWIYSKAIVRTFSTPPKIQKRGCKLSHNGWTRRIIDLLTIVFIHSFIECVTIDGDVSECPEKR